MGLFRRSEPGKSGRARKAEVIAIENRRPIWHASHWEIDLEALEDRLTGLN